MPRPAPGCVSQRTWPVYRFHRLASAVRRRFRSAPATPARQPRLGLEALDAREVPATLVVAAPDHPVEAPALTRGLTDAPQVESAEVAGTVWSGVYDRAGSVDPSPESADAQPRSTNVSGAVWSGVYDR